MELRERLAAAVGQRYDVGNEVGQGGMAHVFAAHDRQLGRPVAIKVLNPDLASSVGAERFQREISVTANLRHPHILKLFDSPAAADGLLYYIMDFVDGESLAQRIAREKQLALDEAIRIVKQAADALDYAHRHGVVHRDIKPANILLEDGNVLVADFGLARIVAERGAARDETRLTQPALVLGTPAYMSPEQFAGDEPITGRSDVYSLACVFHEMLAGDPPFVASTREALRAKHLHAEPPRLCAERPNCPPWFDEVMRRALAKVPADRFATAGEFVRALESGQTSGVRALAARDRATPDARRRRLAASGAAVALAAVVAVMMIRRGDAPAVSPLDPSTFAVVPFTGLGPSSDSAATTERVTEALGEWDGVRVVDGRRVREALSERKGSNTRLRDAIAVARSLGAGRLVWGEGTTFGDSVTLRASLYDAASGRQIRTAAISYPARGAAPASEFQQLANRLLRSRDELPPPGASPRRQSFPAWTAYDEGRVAASAWDLARAEQRFSEALRIDPDHAQAQLWLGRLKMWTGRAPDEWRANARRAVELRHSLSVEDALAAEAQLALAEGRFPAACARYQQLVSRDSSSFAAWFGLGECRFRDSIVVADPRSPSGYSFRASWQRASEAYLRIVDQIPAPHPDFVYARIARLHFTEANILRAGRREGDSRSLYYAYIALDADTLAFVPYALEQLRQVPPSLLEAIEANRRRLSALYKHWIAESPRSVAAHLAQAALLETTGELTAPRADRPSALREIQTARGLADDSVALTLGRTELRLLVKAGRWEAASHLADSLLRSADAGEPGSEALIGTAALAGRVRALGRLFLDQAPGFETTTPDGTPSQVPPALRREVAQLRAEATLGVCNDSVRAWPARLERTIENYYNEPRRRQETRDALLRRPLSLASSCLGAAPLLSVGAGGDPVVAMQQALARGDRRGLAEALRRRDEARRGGRPGDVAIDYTFLESWLLLSLGDSAGAARHLDRSLDALPTLGTYLLNQPAQSAALVRAMVLRADLAHAAGDRAMARRWAGAAAALWARADPELQPVVERMRRVAGAGL